MPPISQATHSGQAANWVWMSTMIAAFRPQHSGMARVASGRDRRGLSQCAVRQCRHSCVQQSGVRAGPSPAWWCRSPCQLSSSLSVQFHLSTAFSRGAECHGRQRVRRQHAQHRDRCVPVVDVEGGGTEGRQGDDENADDGDRGEDGRLGAPVWRWTVPRIFGPKPSRAKANTNRLAAAVLAPPEPALSTKGHQLQPRIRTRHDRGPARAGRTRQDHHPHRE